MSVTRLVIFGAAGRMGRRLVALGSEDPGLKIVAALEAPSHPAIGTDAGTLAGVKPIGIPITSKLETTADAMIDFSVPAAVPSSIATAIEHKIGLVMATTGLTDEHRAAIKKASEKIPVLWAPNMSLAVNLLMKLSAVAAEALKNHPSGTDVEIIERHHRFKEDSPSGTALKFGEIIQGIMGQSKEAHGREGRPGVRPREEIGYHAVRTGDNPGEHTIVFGLLGETIELVVRASSRDCYAYGALSAAKFLTGKPAGSYSIADVLGLAQTG